MHGLRVFLGFSFVMITLSGVLGCGRKPGSTDVPEDNRMRRGQSCESDSDCLRDLTCFAGACDWRYCSQSPNPQRFCAERLAVDEDLVYCETTVCRELEVEEGRRCGSDDECAESLFCALGRCTSPCAGDIDCPGNEACQERPSGGGIQVCQSVVQSCDQASDPQRFCAAELGEAQTRVACEQGVCRLTNGVEGSSCTGDDECFSGLLCEDVCVRSCNGTCRAGFRCLERPSGREGSVCILDDSTPPASCVESADPAQFCAERLGLPPERTLCTAGGICVEVEDPPPGEYSSVLIIDETMDCSDSIAGFAAPGIDLTYVALENEMGDTISYGEVLFFDRGDEPEGNAYGTTALFERIPRVDGSFCPERDMSGALPAGSLVSLGCNGRVVLSFPALGAAGEPLVLAEGQSLAVGEFTNVCRDMQAPDPIQESYNIVLCKGFPQNGTEIAEQCDQDLIRGLSGSSKFSIRFP